MVIFNELRINDDRSALIIDCSVQDLTVYDNMYISEILLYHYKNASSVGEPVNLSKVITVYENTNDDTTIQGVRRCVSLTDISSGTMGVTTFDKGIFFVKVTCDGTIGSEVAQFACGTDDTTDIGVIVDWKTMYDYGMSFVAGMNVCGNNCTPNSAYGQFIMNWFSIKLALSACDFDKLATMWERFLKLTTFSPSFTSGNCGCHA